jgi:hypothetical protein
MRHWSAREAPSVEGMTPRAHPGSNPDCSFIFASRAGDKDGRQRATAAGEQQRRKRLAGILNEADGSRRTRDEEVAIGKRRPT